MARCAKCGAEIRWERKNARWFCFNADGSDHWDACSKRRWRQVKATGERFEREDESGYANSVHGTKFDMKSSGFRRGADYRPSGLCKNCVPPWETCPECPDALITT
jgi:hypothetical protein